MSLTLFCTLYVVFINESENKMKVINFVLVYCDKLTLVSLICDAHEMNIQRQTSVISNFLYIKVFTQVPWTLIYPSFTVIVF